MLSATLSGNRTVLSASSNSVGSFRASTAILACSPMVMARGRSKQGKQARKTDRHQQQDGDDGESEHSGSGRAMPNDKAQLEVKIVTAPIETQIAIEPEPTPGNCTGRRRRSRSDGARRTASTPSYVASTRSSRSANGSCLNVARSADERNGSGRVLSGRCWRDPCCREWRDVAVNRHATTFRDRLDASNRLGPISYQARWLSRRAPQTTGAAARPSLLRQMINPTFTQRRGDDDHQAIPGNVNRT